MNPIVISFYTLNTPYEKEADRLRASCEQFHIYSDIDGVPSLGTWERNCSLKPSFLLEKLKKWQRPVLWVDADAAFLRRPDFKELHGCDLSVRVNEFLPKDHPSRVVSNTIYANQNAIPLLEEWDKRAQEALAQKREMEFWDQMALRDALHASSGLQFLPMPLKYAKIFDFDDLFISEEEVVIEHYQASRRIKHDHCCH